MIITYLGAKSTQYRKYSLTVQNYTIIIYLGANKYTTIQKVQRGSTNSRVAFFEDQ